MVTQTDPHWRDTGRAARFGLIDYRAAFPLMLFLLHIAWWSFFLAIASTVFLAILERFGVTVEIFGRWARSQLAGKRKIARAEWGQARRGKR